MNTQQLPHHPKVSLPLLAACAAGFFLAAPCASAVVTAFFVDDGTANGTTNIGSGISPNNRHSGQSFLATVSGTVTTVRLAIILDTGLGGEDVDIEIFTTSAGVPDTLLGSATIAEASIPNNATTGYTVTADFTSGPAINLTAGTSYALMASTPTPSGMTGNAGVRYFLKGEGGSQTTYPDGNLVISTNDGVSYTAVGADFDINFEVNVIPEPSRTLLLAVASVGVCLRRRR